MLSIIIPTYNEAEKISMTLKQVRDASRIKNEVIVVDGGSADKTVSLAKNAGCRIIKSTLGRGNQLNVGANNAKSNIILFRMIRVKP